MPTNFRRITAPVRIALCQTNTVTGNVPENLKRVGAQISEAADEGADLAVFPEMTLTGYPPRDLLEYPAFLHTVGEAGREINALAARLGLHVLIGQPLTNPFAGKKALVNGAVLYGGEGGPHSPPRMAKKLLPTYDVFDEHRYFEPAPANDASGLMEMRTRRGQRHLLGVTICEDIWNDSEFWKDHRLYPVDPVAQMVEHGAEVIINLSASPYIGGKPERRLKMLQHTARRWNRPVVLVNQVGGNDQVVFDGGSVGIAADGSVIGSSGWFQSRTTVIDTESGRHTELRAPETISAMESALRLGLRDYLEKTGFRRVVVGNSGGIDSAVVLSLCTLELGVSQVISVSLPGPYTSKETRIDSQLLAQNWGIRHLDIPIIPGFRAMHDSLLNQPASGVPQLFDSIGKAPHSVADENLQSRLRGVALMWLSNALADQPTMVVTTGNKSELATGYCTLYGDMCGGLALISDVPKLGVYALARRINEHHGERIPSSIIEREPSAELAPNQKDSDSLPPYPVLDEIVRLHVEERMEVDDLVERGVCDQATAQRIVRLIALNEYKRHQAAPGIKVTSKAFGMGRRMPIARGQWPNG
jgi:NAD+ synthase (glutamine-hydrolysing)